MSSHSQSNHLNTQGGFTLLEVLIAMVLMVMISLAIYQAVTQTFRLRESLLTEGDFHNGVRMAMGIVDRDISAIYSPALMVPPKTEASATPGTNGTNQAQQAQEVAETQEMLSGDLGRSQPFWNGVIDKTGIRPSRFVGTESKMTFVSASHIRVYKDQPESELAQISYELQKDTLIRTESPNAFNEDKDRDKTRKTYPLLPGITKLKFRYYQRDKEQWQTAWDTDSQDHKNIFPDAVEIAIEVKGEPRLFFEGTFRFRPEIPLSGLNPSF